MPDTRRQVLELRNQVTKAEAERLKLQERVRQAEHRAALAEKSMRESWDFVKTMLRIDRRKI
jgi:hypothetical protein